MKLVPLPGIGLLLAKMALVALTGGALFGLAVAGMSAFQFGMGPHAVNAGRHAAIFGVISFLLLGLFWILIRWRRVSAEQDIGSPDV